ncbi:low affinity iron permease family protein [Sphingomonas sp.]|uniref:low affinity iron permease family protein n=1 Tax=Sphingomonas sp. TaxID=28214 RepID=UPI0017C92114|nr:low affinity iron permease family protein [Sphingomonas sp.]MBA4761463.1 low affinity iron permease family protein [Sphingomonas sp.]
MLDRVFTIVAGRIAALAGQPVAFIVAVLLIIGWGLTGPVFGFSDTWQLIVNTSTTIVTFLMVFLIQNSQNRDAAALQAKLDELIRAVEGARNEFIGIEHRSDTEIEAIRAAIEVEVRADGEAHPAATVDRLRNRY